MQPLPKQKLPCLISYGDLVLRPAGYRIPKEAEYYVAKDGHIKQCSAQIPASRIIEPKLIVRIYSDKDFKTDVKTF